MDSSTNMFSKILNVNHPSLVSFPHQNIFSQKTVYPVNFCEILYPRFYRGTLCTQSNQIHILLDLCIYFPMPHSSWQGIDHQMHSIILARRIRVQWSLAPSMLGTNQDDLGLDPGAHIVSCCVDISPPRFHQGLRDSPGRQYCTIKATQVE